MDRTTRTAVVVGIAVACALAASLGAYQIIQRMPVREVEVRSLYQVVAAQELPMGTLLTKDHLKLVAWPASAPVTNGFTAVDQVVNRGLVAPIVANEPLINAAANDFEQFGTQVIAVEADLSTIEGVDRLLDAAEGRQIDLLCANAGHGLGHAFLVTDRTGGRENWTCIDAAGTRNVGRIRDDFLDTHGELVWSRKQQPVPRDPLFTEPDEVMVAIAGCLPWFHAHLDEAHVVTDPDEADRRVNEILDAVKASPYASGDWSAAEDIVASFPAVRSLAP